ncbi:hypothetical protein LTS10_010044 [Elasticomyces elasticus]|nr:hypothetical protein LTS10_010044 [Elasticomyces elasticus]
MDDYESLVNHVFLPPKVPQSEEKLALDTIAKTTASALTAFKGVLADDTQQALLDGVLRMTHASLRTHTNGSVNAEKLEEQLQALSRTGGTIVLHIGAQNAGVLISRHCDDLDSQLAIRFEVFELAPINRAVFQSAGRLMRAFPGAAIDVDLNTFSESGLMNTIARTLAKMSFQPAPGMQPQINKAQAKMDEDRDTTHPGMISEFFMGFLCSLGNPVRVGSISKNTREEVMWRKARSPWRRSPVWLLFRVALQLRLPHTLYKEFMAFMMSSIVTDSRFNALSCDLRYAVTAKIARRLYKLSASPNAAMVMHVQKTLAEATTALEQKWQHIQAQAETVLDLLPLAALDFERDSSNAKIAELSRLKGEYERLMSIYSGSQCDYVEEIVEYATNATESDITETRHYTSSCRRCVSGKQAETMKIKVQEWPLPTKKEAHSRVIVFELQPPSFFVHWRDSLVYLIIDILKATHIPKPGPVANCHLKADGQLSYLQPYRPSQRIGMLSEVKPHTVTHRRELLVSTATDDMVCLDHGSNYRYYDGDAALFVSGFELTDTVSLACTYQLPGRSMALQRFIFRPATTSNVTAPNTVIATLSDCPDHMSLDEYRKLSSLPSGYHVQWSNILVQLALPAVDFKKPESTIVLLQCIYQAGPPGTDILRVGHGFCGDDISAAKLLVELDVALQRIKKNWESSQALSVFISIASRLLSLSASTNLHSDCMEYLRSARAIAFGWMHDLREKAQNVGSHDERKTYLSKRAEVAVICLDSFNVDDAPLADILDSAEQASMLVQCMIIMQESRLLLAESSELTTKLLSMRSQRLLYRCHGALAAHRLALDDGISESWTGFRPGSPWTIAASSHWLTTTTVTGHSGATLRVHFNLITGELLVNGLPLDRLPRKYEDCTSYRTLFGSTTVEVMPTTVPGMDFAAKREFQGYEVQFGMVNTNGLLVQAAKAGQWYELIPKDVFCDTYPAAFTEEHVHWYPVGRWRCRVSPTQRSLERVVRSEMDPRSCTRDGQVALDAREPDIA